MIDREIYFDAVRSFFGPMNQGHVDGQNVILDHWEREKYSLDLRWLAYALATTRHETASTMLPIEEYGKGAGQPYGNSDPTTGQTYFGRGFVQLTWRDNYAKVDKKLGLEDVLSLEWHAENALEPGIAAEVMFRGMIEGWFRGDEDGRQTLGRYFNETVDDPYGAREIINGDKHIIPNWSAGVSVGDLILGYHEQFLSALLGAEVPPKEEILYGS